MNSTTAKPTTPRVLAFEYNDPSGESLDWLEARALWARFGL